MDDDEEEEDLGEAVEYRHANGAGAGSSPDPFLLRHGDDAPEAGYTASRRLVPNPQTRALMRTYSKFDKSDPIEDADSFDLDRGGGTFHKFIIQEGGHTINGCHSARFSGAKSGRYRNQVRAATGS